MRATINNHPRMEQPSRRVARDAMRRLLTARRNAATALAAAMAAGPALPASAYAAPPTTNEIRIGNTTP